MKVTIKYINQDIKAGDTIVYNDHSLHNYTFKGDCLPGHNYSDLIKHIERTIIGKCNLPATQDLIAQLKPGDRILLKPRTCPEYDKTTPRADFLNNLMGFEHKIVIVKANDDYPVYIDNKGTQHNHENIPFLRKEIAKITFICKE